MFSSQVTGKAIIFSAPSGAGKTTLVRYLLSEPALMLAFSVSATSRERRGEEVDGKDYHFLSNEEFQNKVDNNEFVEWEEVYAGTKYGTLKSEVERIWKSGKHVIFDVDVVGGLHLKEIFHHRALAVFVQPPSVEALMDRLKNRSTESEEKIQQRVSKAGLELTYANKFDVRVVNDNLDVAKAEAMKLVNDFLAE